MSFKFLFILLLEKIVKNFIRQTFRNNFKKNGTHKYTAIYTFIPPFSLIEETFAIGCFRGSETKFVKINSTKKTFTPFVQINSCEKNIFHENKFRRKRFSDIFWEKKIPRKKIPTKINTKTGKNFNIFT